MFPKRFSQLALLITHWPIKSLNSMMKNGLSLFNELSRENYDITELDDGADLTGIYFCIHFYFHFISYQRIEFIRHSSIMITKLQLAKKSKRPSLVRLSRWLLPIRYCVDKKKKEKNTYIYILNC